MKRSLEATIAALLTLATPSSLAEANPHSCDTSPITFLGNSYTVAVKQQSRKSYARKWQVGMGNIVAEDNDPNTNDNSDPGNRCARKKKVTKCRTRRGKQRCRTYTKIDRSRCDLIAFDGRTVYDMYNKLPQIKQELTRLGSNRVVIYEGPNSLNPGKSDDASVEKRLNRVLKVLRLIVNDLQGHTVNGKPVEVYMATVPLGVIGYSSNLDAYTLSMYNNGLANVGAKGTIDISDIAWTPQKLHGYQPPFTFQQTLSAIHDRLNKGCGYSKHPKSYFDQKWIEYQRCVADRQAGKRRKRCDRYR